MDSLPVELKLKIFYNLDVKSLYNLSVTDNKHMKIYTDNAAYIYSKISKRDGIIEAHSLVEYLKNNIIHIKQIERDNYDCVTIKRVMRLLSGSVYKEILHTHISTFINFSNIINRACCYKDSRMLLFFAINGINPQYNNKIYDAIIRNMNIFHVGELFRYITPAVLSRSHNAIFHRLGIDILSEDKKSVIDMISIVKPCFKFVKYEILRDNIEKLEYLKTCTVNLYDFFNFRDLILY